MLSLLHDFPFGTGILCFTLLTFAWASFMGALYFRIPYRLFGFWEQNAHEWLQAHAQHANTLELFQQPLPHRSICTKCRNPLRWHQLIPIVSYCWHKGKCVFCNQRIDPMYSLIELCIFFTMIILWNQHTDIWLFFFSAISISILIVLAAIDYRHFLLPDIGTFTLLWIGLMVQALYSPTTLASSVLWMCSVYLSLTILSTLYTFWRKLEGLGQGDIKLFTALASWFTLEGIMAIFLCACIIAIIFQCAKYVYAGCKGHQDAKNYFAFGPYIALCSIYGILTPNTLTTPFTKIVY